MNFQPLRGKFQPILSLPSQHVSAPFDVPGRTDTIEERSWDEMEGRGARDKGGLPLLVLRRLIKDGFDKLCYDNMTTLN